MIRRAYDSVMSYASHPRATWWMNFIAFVESSVFPFPPDPLFIAMVLKHREHAFKYALMCTVSSVLGGIVGYWIGYAAFETIGEWIVTTYGFEESFQNFQRQIDQWGFWIIALKGLTPIPFKFVTIASGVVHFNFKLFIIASVIARGFRFFSLSLLLWYKGEHVKGFIERNLYIVTTVGLIVLIGGIMMIKYLF